MYKVLSILLIIYLYTRNCAYNCAVDDLYSSIPALAEVLKSEKLYIENSEIYYRYASKILITLRRKFFDVKSSKTYSFSIKQKLQYISALDVIKKVKYVGFSSNISYYNNIHKFPTNEDLNGVTEAIDRLREVYGLNVKSIVDGSFLSINNSKKLCFQDCFKIGQQLFKIGKIVESEQWLDIAYELYTRKQNTLMTKRIEQWEILDLLAQVRFNHGDAFNIEEAIKFTKRAIKLNENSQHLQFQLKEFKEKYQIVSNNYSQLDYDLEVFKFYKGCRGQLEKSEKQIRKLYCTYKYGRNFFLKIAPFKMEIQNFQPYVVIFHDVVYDTEISLLKNLSENHLSRALVWDSELARSIPAKYRTSKVAWLSNALNPLLQILNQRISDMTDMTMETSEVLQVMNYGIGGHYDSHADYFPEPVKYESKSAYWKYKLGNRIATVLIYLSDVEQGGTTVFPHIKTVLKPKKNSAAFWFNLFPDGSGNPKTRHAACPVLFGSKWVANKWIRYNGQISLRPCKINKDEHFEVFTN